MFTHMYVVCLCVNIHLMHNIMSHATMQLQSISSIWSFVGEATASIVLCCPDGEKVDNVLLLHVTAANWKGTTKLLYCVLSYLSDETDSLPQLQLAW